MRKQPNTRIGRELRLHRQTVQLSAEAVAGMIGKTEQTVRLYERGAMLPGLDTFIQLLEIYKVNDLDGFFGGDITGVDLSELVAEAVKSLNTEGQKKVFSYINDLRLIKKYKAVKVADSDSPTV